MSIFRGRIQTLIYYKVAVLCGKTFVRTRKLCYRKDDRAMRRQK